MCFWFRAFACVAFAAAGIAFGAANAWGQVIPPPQTTAPPQTTTQPQAATGRVRVFLDCGACFETFLRDEIEWVDFVRQQQDADVHILGTSTSTGGGGQEVALRFIGRGRFQGSDLELKSVSPAGDTDDQRRTRILRTISIGLLTYVERGGQGDAVKIDVEALKRGEGQTTVAADPWHAWVFSLRGSASFDYQETDRRREYSGRVTADRVTEQWILGFASFIEVSREEFELDEDETEGEPLKVSRHEHGVNWFVARALGPHWSVAFQGETNSSTFGNRNLSFQTGPAIEYNLFPYADYASRQWRFTYALGMQHSQYNEVTLYDKLQETHPIHNFETTLQLVQPWGELQTNFEFIQYLHDLSKYRIEVGAEASLQLTRSFSVNFDGSASRIRDQLSLPKRDADPEEVLLRLRQLQSDYQIDFSINLTYRFGSIFNNIVNPRFGRD